MAKYIDADEMADLLTPIIDGYDVDDKSAREWIVGYNECCLDLLKELKKMPAADVAEVKHGRWVLITKDGIVPAEFLCSVCGRKISYNSGVKYMVSKLYPYCHCGAKMDGEQE